MKTAGDEISRIENYALPIIGSLLLDQVRRQDIKQLMASVAQTPSLKTG